VISSGEMNAFWDQMMRLAYACFRLDLQRQGYGSFEEIDAAFKTGELRQQWQTYIRTILQ